MPGTPLRPGRRRLRKGVLVAKLNEEKTAPVQGWAGGIPWSLHLEAYAAYCRKYGSQEEIIDQEGCNCRGGFDVLELDELVPDWRQRTSSTEPLREETAPCSLKNEDVQWPKARDVGRLGDMSPATHLRVGLDSENDAFVSIWSESGSATIEFCVPGSGGGRSSRTRMALIALMVAIEADNADTPSLDWWARRGVKAEA
jgi:hypothetical protein